MVLETSRLKKGDFSTYKGEGAEGRQIADWAEFARVRKRTQININRYSV